MKTKVLFLFFIAILNSKITLSQFQPAIVQDWAEFIEYQDSIIRIPIVIDAYDHIVTGGFVVDSVTGADLMVAEYKGDGELIWQRTYSSSGYHRDQATAIAIDDSNNVYVAGSIYNSITNYDFIILKYDTAGILKWTSTFNGTANSIDIPSAIIVNSWGVFVCGALSNSNNQIDYGIVALNRTNGSQLWSNSYDYAGLYDVPIAMSQDGGKFHVTGGSQQSLTQWDYCTVVFNHGANGAIDEVLRVEGTENSFDRVKAICQDNQGNFYLTGAAADSGEGFNIKTIKVNSGDTIEWIAAYNGTFNEDDEGNGVVSDSEGNIYVCGKTTTENSDYIIIKYDSNGNELLSQTYTSGFDDEAIAICIDGFGNIIVTGKAMQNGETYNFYTVAYNTELEELWHQSFDGAFHGNDYAAGITADDKGNIYVTGQSQILGDLPTYEQVTIKYRTDYFIFPQKEDSLSLPSSLLFYPNTGQLLNDTGGVASNVYNYTINQNPKIYFHDSGIAFVLAHIDGDTSTTDSLERIDMSFFNGSSGIPPLQNNIHEKDQILNYYLPNCPEGITNVQGAENLTFGDVYSKTDVIFSNNNVGMKFQIIVNEGGDPNEITLHFNGHQSLSLVSNSDLRIEGMLGSFIYERPLVYQIDDEGARISLGWIASYNIVDSADVKFFLGGDYDPSRSLVIECARTPNSNQGASVGNLDWSTYYGDAAYDIINASNSTISGKVITAGTTCSPNLPLSAGSIYVTNVVADAWIMNLEPITGVINWVVYYGASGHDVGEGIDSDDQEDVYFVGYTWSSDLPQNIDPLLSTLDPYIPGYGYNLLGGQDHYITKLSSNGASLLWSNYIGGNGSIGDGENEPCAVVVDKYGDQSIYMAGTTGTLDFPVLSSSLSNAYNQMVNNSDNGIQHQMNGFVMQFDQAGVPLWSSYFGGDNSSYLHSIALAHYTIGGNDNIHLYISSVAGSMLYDQLTPCEPPAQMSGFPNCDANNTADQYAYAGGNTDAYLAEFDKNHELIWSTFIGGIDQEITNGNKLAAYDNTVYLGMQSTPDGTGFPVPASCTGCFTQPHQSANPPYYDDAYVARFDNRILTWSTFLGGEKSDALGAIHINDEKLYVCGNVQSESFPTSYCSNTPLADEFPLCDAPGYYFVPGLSTANIFPHPDAFITAFDASNQIIWSTPIGGNNGEYGATMASVDNTLLMFGFTNSNYISNNTEDYPQQFFVGAYNQPSSASPGINEAFISRFGLIPWVGIDEQSPANNYLSCYPNPTNGIFTIQLDQARKNADLKILDVLGRTVFHQKPVEINGRNQILIDISTLDHGIYFVILNNENTKSIAKISKYE